MSETYPYNKASVNNDKLELEILAEAGITKTLERVSWAVTNNLNITFDAALSGGEETLLDTIAANHDGNPATIYPKFCMCCSTGQKITALTEPTDCPCCGKTGCLVDCPCTSGLALRGFTYRQDTEPTLERDDDWCLWYDTNDDVIWMIFRVGSGDQRKVEMT